MGIQTVRTCVCLLPLLGFCTMQAAAATTWHLAPGRTAIKFKIKHLVVAQVNGKFRDYEGTVITENEGFSGAVAEASISVKSVYTGHEDRDSSLLSDDFFSAGKFPDITFKSAAWVKTGEHAYEIPGDLTVRGVTKPITLKARWRGKKTIPGGKTCICFTATGSLNRFDYGLRWNELTEAGRVIASETVELTIELALVKED